jgi:hypothetical protein
VYISESRCKRSALLSDCCVAHSNGASARLSLPHVLLLLRSHGCCTRSVAAGGVSGSHRTSSAESKKPYDVAHVHVSHICMHLIEPICEHADVFACRFIAWGFLLSADVGGNAGDNAVGFVSSSLSFSTRLNTMVSRCPILLHTPPTHYSDPDGEFRRLKPGQAHEVYCHP